MRAAHALAAAVMCASLAACDHESSARSRPSTVPATAVWAGGADGGAWITCMPLDRKPYRYRCFTYNDQSGSIWAEGEYVLRSAQWNEKTKGASFSPVADVPTQLKYTSFDGEIIRLAHPLVLVPDGWIKYPLAKGGKKQLFELGQTRSAELAYD